MKNGKKLDLDFVLVIITCLCAIMANVQVAYALYSGNTDSFSFALHIICAILWDISLVLRICWYRKDKKNKK